MKIILTQDVPKVGSKHDIKEVSSGHALNLLIPKGLAIVATPTALKRAELEKAKTEGERRVQEELLSNNLKSLESVSITISGKANEKGHLFAGLHKEILAEELEKQTHIKVNPSFINMEHPLKEVGEHSVEVKVGGKSVKFKVIVKKL